MLEIGSGGGINFNYYNSKNIKLLNVLETNIYVRAIHEKYIENAIVNTGTFYKDKELYNIISSKQLKYKIIPYTEDITLAHITQLFPMIEFQIRELGKLLNIVPFKLSEKEFMKFKDPSSILREILLDVYRQLGSYENVSDLLFVYHFLYNGNSLNIRNECIHGRKYTKRNDLKFAFKIVLFSLYMIVNRIEIINENMKK